MGMGMGMGKRERWGAVVAAFASAATLAIVLYSPPVEAHAIGLSSGEYSAKGASVVAKLAFARGEVATLAPSIDENRDGHLTPAEVEAARTTLKSKILDRVSVTRGGSACSPTLTDAGLTEQDGLLLTGRWDCASSTQAFEVDVALLDELTRGHRHVARAVSGANVHDEVLYGDHRRFTIAPLMEPGTTGASVPGAAEPAASDARARKTSAASFFKMGIEHILTGYDHLVFILGLVLARARFRSLLTVITAFTVAHSITLALAVLNVWAPSSRIVEPAIALSIAYVGVENFFVRDASKRWRITFPFGLIHGFGFAGALQEIALPRSAVPTALVSFNLGVEAGQLSVLAVVLPIVLLLRGKAWFEPLGVRVVSGAVALAGGIWFVARVVG
jgi:hydrogenase/urease accessory protein HupE